jgi:signal transduction histidine kinase
MAEASLESCSGTKVEGELPWNNKSAMPRNPHLPSLASRLFPSIVLGFTIALIGAFLELTVDHHPSTFASLDDLAVGIISALVVFAYEQRRYRALMRRLQIIASMNHHVRNALQAISYSPYAKQEQQMQVIQDSVARIQWALDQVLTGKRMDESHAAVIAGGRNEAEL